MNLIYAMGGGLGHLARVKRLVTAWSLYKPMIVTANPLASKLFDPSELELVPVNPSQQVQINREAIQRLLPNARALYIDVFPAGLLGELEGLETGTTPVHYLARRLVMDRYPFSWPTITTTHVFEPLEHHHQQKVDRHSQQVKTIPFPLGIPEPEKATECLPNHKGPIWLVVHAFDADEVQQLLDLALQQAELAVEPPVILVITDQSVKVPPGVRVLNYFPALDLYPMADCIFTGCGFNTVHELAPFRQKHTAVPFPRKLDDQFWRFREFL